MVGDSLPTETTLSAGACIGLVTTRRAQPAADSLAGRLIAKYVLRDMLASMSAPLHELSNAHVVVLKAPPVVTANFEHDLFNYIHKLLALNLLALVVVQPSLRRKPNKTLWVHKWNQLPQAPLKYIPDMLLQDRKSYARLPSDILCWQQ